MTDFNRRQFAALAGASLLLPLFNIKASAATAPRVVVIGGGFGGATFAKYMRKASASAKITLVEPKTTFISCVGSNEALVGISTLQKLSFTYTKLKSLYGVTQALSPAQSIDAVNKTVRLASGAILPYDRLVLSTGIEFRYDAIEGWNQSTEALLPSAWHAGPETTKLAAQLKALPKGGTFIITVPPMPYRCPPAPYERASLVAWYLKKNNPTAKVLILDANATFPKQPLFEEGWAKLYPGMVSRIVGNVTAVDAANRSATTADATYKGGVLNVIPPQKASALAVSAGLVDATGWCPVDVHSFESKLVPGVHVIGDAAASGLPKSGTSASGGAKAAAEAIGNLLTGKSVTDPVIINTCYSRLAPDYGIGIASVFGVDAATGKIAVREAGAGTGMSPVGASTSYRRKEASDATKWFKAMMADTFA
ncbi:NAD(P)/FAD-dependent oxidoreductase [Oryzibacter oryziterrae]|uniref:NAD(P)/FAD-dependent oxidoreductase n=1 Tax=Oryzibacter oryziterrae TaxID=2766474 RepID=UPI001F38B5B4|nr:NAD(P)/FAD-dependent oxidoreductase [Oryzibacter oryziterrae]